MGTSSYERGGEERQLEGCLGLFSLFFFVFTQNRLVRIFGNNANSFVQVGILIIILLSKLLIL